MAILFCSKYCVVFRGPGWLSRYNDSLWGFTALGSNPSAVFRTRPDWPWGPPSLQYKRSLPGINRPGRGVDRPSQSTAEVKEKVELCIYSSCGSSWHVVGWASPFPAVSHYSSCGSSWHVVGWASPFPAVSHCQYHFDKYLHSCSTSGGNRIFGSRDK